ncbi:hypothetical protein [Halobacillus massiliensis]|nr:hypothetical protein [Halobacillus massiliensis]
MFINKKAQTTNKGGDPMGKKAKNKSKEDINALKRQKGEQGKRTK